MIKGSVLLIGVIAVAIGIIVSTMGDTSQYVDFKQAFASAQAGDEDKYHVIGQLPKDGKGHPVGLLYHPENDPNDFRFQMVDEHGLTREVIYQHPKPQDFERSEKIVIVGRAEGQVFMADKILLKCPSKYQSQEFKEAAL